MERGSLGGGGGGRGRGGIRGRSTCSKVSWGNTPYVCTHTRARMHAHTHTHTPVLDVPEHGPAQVDVVLHESHAGVPRPALLVVVANDVLVVGVGVLREVALDQVPGLLRREPGGAEGGSRV